jgi:prepilin-type N-terminal cleavage/methylation domain-containing protein
MAKRRNRNTRGFTLIEVLVAIGILGILMTAIMVAFQQTVDAVNVIQENAEVMQSVRAASEQFHRELSQAIINNNRPDGEQVYFEIKQLAENQSVIRFGCTTERGLIEIGYQVKPDPSGWPRYELWRMYKSEKMWDYSESPDWPALTFQGTDNEPFAFGIVGLLVKYWDSKQGKWLARDWESMQRNAMPKRLQITLLALTKSKAKEARNIKSLNDISGVQKFPIEITLPQAR